MSQAPEKWKKWVSTSKAKGVTRYTCISCNKTWKDSVEVRAHQVLVHPDIVDDERLYIKIKPRTLNEELQLIQGRKKRDALAKKSFRKRSSRDDSADELEFSSNMLCKVEAETCGSEQDAEMERLQMERDELENEYEALKLKYAELKKQSQLEHAGYGSLIEQVNIVRNAITSIDVESDKTAIDLINSIHSQYRVSEYDLEGPFDLDKPFHEKKGYMSIGVAARNKIVDWKEAQKFQRRRMNIISSDDEEDNGEAPTPTRKHLKHQQGDVVMKPVSHLDNRHINKRATSDFISRSPLLFDFE